MDLGNSDVVVIIGPNNAGKSAALRALRNKIAHDAPSPIIGSIGLERQGTGEQLVAWLDSFARAHGVLPPHANLQAFGVTVNPIAAKNLWERRDIPLNDLTRFFCHLLSAEERLQVSNPAANIAIGREPLDHPMHGLLRDDALERRVSDQFRRAFGVDLVLNRFAGKQVQLHVGERPVPKLGQDRLSAEFIQSLEELPLLHQQGDGMRSFAGVLLHTLVGREGIMLIDEPEAFLHPPQARELGRMLITDKPEWRQLFVATHSGDVLRGMLDAKSTSVRVVRICRQGTVNHIRQLDNEKIAELWSDPLLRYSNILDGLFHEKVVVCEADADARFYAAVTDAIISSKESGVSRRDLMFTHCGGKARLATVMRALREVDVPVAVAADFDVLNNNHPLRAIVDAAGGVWTKVQSDWTEVKAAIDSRKPELTTPEVVEKIQAELASVSGDSFPRAQRESIQRILKRSTSWSTAKEVGKRFVPSGQATQAYERLVTALRELGIFVVEVGELESFVQSVGGHGPKWVNEALKKDLLGDEELDAARRFVSSLTA